MYIRKHFGLILLMLIAMLIKIFSSFPMAVERYYSNGIYPVISTTQRTLLGWIPFSVGDIFYGVVVIYLVSKTARFIKKIIRKQIHRSYLLHVGKKVAVAALL